MNLVSAVSDLLDGPHEFVRDAKNAGLGWTGLAAYALGVFSCYVFLRLFSAVPPGIYSFSNIFLLALGLNFFFAASIHLFLEMTGSEGSAVRLFLMFGFTELFWGLLVPLGFLAKLGCLTPVSDFLLCFLFVIIGRIAMIKRLYSVSSNKAFLAVGLPYAALIAGSFMAFVYGIVYLVWLVI